MGSDRVSKADNLKAGMRLSEDLRNRTKQFASDVIQLYVTLPKRRKEVEILGNQLLRSGTSVAAHAREASRARSDSEFCSKLDGLLQEAVEKISAFQISACQLFKHENPLR